jgi:hypothetical protein
LSIKTPSYIAGLFVILLTVSNIQAQTQLEIIPDTNLIRIGEQVNLSIVVKANQGDVTEITWPIVSDTLTEQIDVVKVMPVDTFVDAGINLFTQQWILTSFDTGQQVIPPFELVINGEEKETDPFLLKVETMEVDTTQAIKNIKGVQGVPISFLDWLKYHWQWFAGLGVLAILIVGIYLILRNRKKVLTGPVKKAVPLVPPSITALKRLNELSESKLWRQGEVKQHHSEISEILREYLEFQFSFPALEQTTGEVMQTIRLTEISSDQQKQLRRMLMLSDLVKYAKEKPGDSENLEILNLAFEFVNATKPAEKSIESVENVKQEAEDEA